MDVDMELCEMLPMISIQCDWHSALRDGSGNAWVSCKYKDQPSKLGKIKASGDNYIASDGFAVEKVKNGCIQVSVNDCPHSTVFVPPTKVYSDIHQKSVTSLSVGSNGLAVSASSDDKLHIWDTDTDLVKRKLEGHVGEVYRCRFYPSGIVVLTGGSDMQIKIWSAETGQCPVTLTGHSMAVTDFAMVERGKNIISVGKDGAVKLWSCGAAKCIADLAQLPVCNCCAISSASSDFPLPKSSPSAQEEGTEDKILLVGCEDGSVHCVGVQSRQVLFKVNVDSPVNTVAFSSPSEFLVGCQDGRILKYSVQSAFKPVKVWHWSNSAVLALKDYQGEGFVSTQADGSVLFRLYKDSSVVLSFTGADCDPVYDIDVSGFHLYACCRDSNIRRYNLKSTVSAFY